MFISIFIKNYVLLHSIFHNGVSNIFSCKLWSGSWNCSRKWIYICAYICCYSRSRKFDSWDSSEGDHYTSSFFDAWIIFPRDFSYLGLCNWSTCPCRDTCWDYSCRCCCTCAGPHSVCDKTIFLVSSKNIPHEEGYFFIVSPWGWCLGFHQGILFFLYPQSQSLQILRAFL